MNSKKIDKKTFMSICKILFLILVTIFLAKYFITSWDDIKQIEWSKFNWGIFVLSILLYFVYKISLASLWHYITMLNQCSISYTKAVTSYLYSILGKYIPGKVFMLAARIPGYQENDSKGILWAGVNQAAEMLGAHIPERLVTILMARNKNYGKI